MLRIGSSLSQLFFRLSALAWVTSTKSRQVSYIISCRANQRLPIVSMSHHCSARWLLRFSHNWTQSPAFENRDFDQTRLPAELDAASGNKALQAASHIYIQASAPQFLLWNDPFEVCLNQSTSISCSATFYPQFTTLHRPKPMQRTLSWTSARACSQ